MVKKETWSEWIHVNMLFVFDLHVLSVAFVLCFILFLIHCYLIITNQTTWEKASRKRITYFQVFGDEEKYNPFNEGYLKNVSLFLCYFKEIKWEIPYKQFINKVYAKECDEVNLQEF